MKDIKINIEELLNINLKKDIQIELISVKDDNTLFSFELNGIKMKGYACYGDKFEMKDYFVELIPLITNLEETYNYIKVNDSYIIENTNMYCFIFEDLLEDQESLLTYEYLDTSLEIFQIKLSKLENSKLINLDVRTNRKDVKKYFKNKDMNITYLSERANIAVKDDKLFFPNIFAFYNYPKEWRYNQALLNSLLQIKDESRMIEIIKKFQLLYPTVDIIKEFNIYLEYYEKLDEKVESMKLFSDYYKKIKG